MPAKSYLGIDGGATKTGAVLIDNRGTVLARTRGPGSAVIGEPSQESREVLFSTSREVLASAGLTTRDLTHCAIGLAGVDFEDAHAMQLASVSDCLHIPAHATSLVNDAIVARTFNPLDPPFPIGHRIVPLPRPFAAIRTSTRLQPTPALLPAGERDKMIPRVWLLQTMSAANAPRRIETRILDIRQTTTNPEQPKMSRTNRIVQLFIGAALFSFLLTGCGDAPPNTPGEVAKRYHEALADGDLEKVVSAMPPDPNRKLTQEAKDAFRQGAELIKSKDLNFDSVKVIDEQIDGDTATVKLQAVGPNGVEVHLESQTLRIDGVWYVDTEPPTSP